MTARWGEPRRPVVRVKTDYMKVKVLIEYSKALDDCINILRSESEKGDLYSGLQADVIEPINKHLKQVLEGRYGI
jgi:hypothetical protein